MIRVRKKRAREMGSMLEQAYDKDFTNAIVRNALRNVLAVQKEHRETMASASPDGTIFWQEDAYCAFFFSSCLSWLRLLSRSPGQP